MEKNNHLLNSFLSITDDAVGDNTKWIDISGKNDPPKAKHDEDTGYPKPEIPVFSPEKLDIYQLGLNYGKWAGLFLAVWALGRLRFSIIWVFLAAAAITWLWNSRRVRRKAKLALSTVNDTTSEKKEVLAKIKDLPSWVYFPDVERAEWLNKIIKQMWPYINEYVKVLIKNQIEPQVKEKLPAIIKNFHFETIDMGDIPPRVGGIKVYQERVNRDEIIIDMEIYYSGDAEIVLNVNKIKSGVKNINFHGNIRAHIYPLISTIPFVGALKVFLLNRPAIDFDLTQLANALDFPGLSELIRKVMMDVLASMIVLPNKFGLILSKDVEARQIKYFIPKGIIRITIFSAHNLINADVHLLGKGKSDPYAKIYVGAKEFKTSVVNNNLNPVWNEAFEAIVDEPFGQRLEVNVMDQDPNKDDFLGRVELDIESIVKQGFVDSTFNLEDIKHGDIHLRADWLRPLEPFVLADEVSGGKEKDEKAGIVGSADAATSNTDASRANVDETIRANREESLQLLNRELGIIDQEFTRANVKGSLSTAILVVYVDSAKNLPFPSNLATEPSPYVLFTVAGGEGSVNNNISNMDDIKTSNKNKSTAKDIASGEANKYKTQTKAKTTNPVWEQCFTLLINNPTLCTLNVEVKDEKSGRSLGRMTYPIGKILDEPHFDKTGNFQLTTQGYADATLSLTMSLRMLQSGADPNFNRPDFVKAGPNINRTDKGAESPGGVPVVNKRPIGGGAAIAAGPVMYAAGGPGALKGHEMYGNITPPMSPRELNLLYRDEEGIAVDSEGRPLTYAQQEEFFNPSIPTNPSAAIGKPILYEPTDIIKDPQPGGGIHLVDPQTAAAMYGGVTALPRKSLPLIHNNSYENNRDFLKRRNTTSPRVLLNFYYDDVQHKLIVLLERVENINVSGDLSNADTYVKLELLPPQKESTKRKSIVIKNSLNPTFNEKFEWNVPGDDLNHRKLAVSVKTEGGLLRSGQSLGSTLVDLSQVEYNEPRGFWFPLDDTNT